MELLLRTTRIFPQKVVDAHRLFTTCVSNFLFSQQRKHFCPTNWCRYHRENLLRCEQWIRKISLIRFHFPCLVRSWQRYNHFLRVFISFGIMSTQSLLPRFIAPVEPYLSENRISLKGIPASLTVTPISMPATDALIYSRSCLSSDELSVPNARECPITQSFAGWSAQPPILDSSMHQQGGSLAYPYEYEERGQENGGMPSGVDIVQTGASVHVNTEAVHFQREPFARNIEEITSVASAMVYPTGRYTQSSSDAVNCGEVFYSDVGQKLSPEGCCLRPSTSAPVFLPYSSAVPAQERFASHFSVENSNERTNVGLNGLDIHEGWKTNSYDDMIVYEDPETSPTTIYAISKSSAELTTGLYEAHTDQWQWEENDWF